MLDKIIDKHKHPWSLFFHLIGLIAGIYGVWIHSWTWIIIAIVLLAIGHIFPYKTKTTKTKKSKK